MKKNPWNPKQFKKSKVKGNQTMWENAAKALTSDAPTNDLEILGLSAPPNNLRELQKARNAAMLKAHPDRGGSNAQAQAVQEAYENLKLVVPVT